MPELRTLTHDLRTLTHVDAFFQLCYQSVIEQESVFLRLLRRPRAGENARAIRIPHAEGWPETAHLDAGAPVTVTAKFERVIVYLPVSYGKTAEKTYV